MYRLLIVDDESLIRNGLKNLIEWEIYGIEIIGEAEDGMKAYLSVKSQQPDLVLVDISMPNVSGLELIELCSQLDSPPKFIILSGYNHFQYVQKAIQLGAIDYLLKPVNQEELINTIISATKQLDRIHTHQQQFQESLLALRDDILRRLLYNRIDSREFREKCQVINISLHCSHMRTGIIRPLNCEDKIIPLLSIIELCEEHCTRLCSCYLISDSNDNIGIIFKDQLNTLSEEDYLNALSSCADAILSAFHIHVLYALGKEANNIKELPLSYSNCIAKIEKKMILGNSVETQIAKTDTFTETDYFDFLKTLEAGDENQIRTAIHSFFSRHIPQDTEEAVHILKYHLIELVTYVLHSKYMVGFSGTDITNRKNKAFSIISKTDSIFLLEENLFLFFLSLTETFSSDTISENYSFLIQNVISYINDNYADDNLSLKTLASQLDVNAAYLGREFAQETGEYFNDYLNRIRTAKAIHLLTTTTWKSGKIANSVGFSNASYFFTVFKKITGQSPGDYRAKHR